MPVICRRVSGSGRGSEVLIDDMEWFPWDDALSSMA